MPALSRVGLVLAMVVTVVVVALALPERGTSTPATEVSAASGAADDGDRIVRSRASRDGARLVDLTPTLPAGKTSTTSTPTSTAPTSTTAPGSSADSTTTTAAPATTTTTRPPTTTTTTAPPTTTTTAAPARASSNSQEGKASWYDHEPGICAHRTLPFGTVVTVTNTDNGRRTRCTVHDRGPYIDGWIIDLNPREFEQLAPLDEGVIPVRITW